MESTSPTNEITVVHTVLLYASHSVSFSKFAALTIRCRCSWQILAAFLGVCVCVCVFVSLQCDILLIRYSIMYFLFAYGKTSKYINNFRLSLSLSLSLCVCVSKKNVNEVLLIVIRLTMTQISSRGRNFVSLNV